MHNQQHKKMSMGKREKPQPVSWKSQLSPPSSHLSIVIAYFFYRCTAVRTSSNSSVSPEIAIRATMNNDRSSGGSSNGTTPPPSAGNDHEGAPPPPYPTFGGLLDAEVSFDGEQGPPVRSASQGEILERCEAGHLVYLYLYLKMALSPPFFVPPGFGGGHKTAFIIP